MEVDLITPFFSAIFTFSKSVLSKELEILEMGDLRFVFKKMKTYIFIIIADDTENLLFLNSRLEKISKIFLKNLDHVSLKDGEVIINEEFDNKIDPIIYGIDDVFFSKKGDESKKTERIIEFFKELIKQNEIIGASLISMEGNLLYSSLSEKTLLRVMREIEIRFTSGTLDVPETFCIFSSGNKICERIIDFGDVKSNLLLIIEFDKKTTLGMAEWISDEISAKLIKELSH
ncbi:MAG: hypothetical protein ACP6IY_05955 [Promethearchaeia archaeon]